MCAPTLTFYEQLRCHVRVRPRLAKLRKQSGFSNYRGKFEQLLRLLGSLCEIPYPLPFEFLWDSANTGIEDYNPHRRFQICCEFLQLSIDLKGLIPPYDHRYSQLR